ncbi:LysE family translocator [Achromobacter ruhlandii]|uniref:LysE family translocator n=1 Tax=Achromobacter ruhlandii TaxID=72557 RepID=A0ABM8LX88_9BURK|nr:LysE family transporter [Achromobacter ruhlandii]AOU92708.1 putative threonine/homoserine/homoserine lactone efflux protein [Achromobacter ruhlandii]MCZ8430783.1 LysE family transporter [Achromobacter ruhlandii]MDC6091909.1 LysE family transporter [Achromobacter ruhlandii]MDC6150253.1 LysE family transporter [Achromobacter ruhlandii]MDD7978548.1 LysE family transporter [Achromobacter ruhlandii]
MTGIDWVFLLGTAAILLTPGPTNTLLAAAGLARGFRRAAPLVGFELAGYLTGITTWGLFLVSAQAVYPWIGIVVRIASSVYLAYVAVRIWCAAGEDVANRKEPIGPYALFVATLLNPKGLVFASTLFPAHAFEHLPGYLAAMGQFIGLLVPIAFVWIKFGAVLAGQRIGFINPERLQRTAALVIGVFSVSIVGSAVRLSLLPG